VRSICVPLSVAGWVVLCAVNSGLLFIVLYYLVIPARFAWLVSSGFISCGAWSLALWSMRKLKILLLRQADTFAGSTCRQIILNKEVSYGYYC